MSNTASISNRLPVQIDPIRLAVARQILTGTLPLKSCKRLNNIVVSDDETSSIINVDLEFGIDSEKIHYCTGKISADLDLICQRCLEPMTWQAKSRVNLAFVKNDHEAESLPGVYEPYILHSVPLVMSDIIEDELLLELPQVPLHDEAECPASEILHNLTSDTQSDTPQAGDNPFAALESLKNDPKK